MDRSRDSRTRLLGAAGLALIGVLLVAAPAAPAAPPALDEYSLELPAVVNDPNRDVGPVGSPAGDSNRAASQEGVAGEGLPHQSALDAASSLVGGGGVALGLCALACLVLGVAATRAPRDRIQT